MKENKHKMQTEMGRGFRKVMEIGEEEEIYS